MNRLQQLREAGVSIWLDTLSRPLLESGDFARLVEQCGVTGTTSNPTIFATAITGSDRYDGQLHAVAAAGTRDPRAIFFALALDDIRRAADVLCPCSIPPGGATASCPSSARPTLLTTPRRPSSRRWRCGSGWPART